MLYNPPASMLHLSVMHCLYLIRAGETLGKQWTTPIRPPLAWLLVSLDGPLGRVAARDLTSLLPSRSSERSRFADFCSKSLLRNMRCPLLALNPRRRDAVEAMDNTCATMRNVTSSDPSSGEVNEGMGLDHTMRGNCNSGSSTSE